MTEVVQTNSFRFAPGTDTSPAKASVSQPVKSWALGPSLLMRCALLHASRIICPHFLLRLQGKMKCQNDKITTQSFQISNTIIHGALRE